MANLVDPTSVPADAVSRLRTFLIADMRGYTAYTVERGDSEAARVAARFAATARRAVEEREGHLLEIRGDEALAVFDSARQALRAAVDLQRLRVEEDLPLPIGIGLDAGEAVPLDGGFRGAALNLAARLCSLAGPDEVLASETVASLARHLDDLTYVDRGAVRLKGFADDVRVRQIMPAREPVPPQSVPEENSSEQHLAIGGFLGALPSNALVGRQVELRRAAAAIEAVVDGNGRLLLLSGEPGVGKTRLAQEITLLVRDRGFLIAVGRCYEPHAAVPFYPFLDALRTVYLACPASLKAMVASRWPQLGRLVPDGGIPAPPPAASAHEEQQRTYWAVTSFLQAAAEWRPMAVLLDDLHWADSPSLELLQHLTEHARESRILLLGTYRDTDIDRSHPLSRVILDLSRERLVERVRVERLDAADTASLVAEALGSQSAGDELAPLVFQHTGGNPLFAEELARSLSERGGVSEDLEIPETVRSVIAERVGRLRVEDQEILLEASVLGQTFSFDDLQAVTDRGEDALDTALAAAVGLGVVREMGDSYMFSHALTQASLYTELSPRKRRRLHRAAADVLGGLPEAARNRRASELARHHREAGDVQRALPWLVTLGDQAEAAWSHDDAAKQYNLALDAAVETGDQRVEAAVCEKLGGLFTAVIRYSVALEMLERASRLYAALGDIEGEARTVAQMGRVHLPGGSAGAGIERIGQALHSLDDRASPSAQAQLYSSLARCLAADARHAEALSAAERAIELAPASTGVHAEATVTRGGELAMLGRWTEGLAVLTEAVGEAEVAPDLFSACRGSQYIAGIQIARGEFRVAHAALEKALSLADRMQNGRQMGTCMLGLATLAFLAGERDTAREMADRALPIMQALGGAWLSLLYSAGLSLSLSPEEWSGAPAPLKEGVLQTESGTPMASLRAQQLTAARHLAEGRPEEARQGLQWLLRDTRLEGEQTVFMDQLGAEIDAALDLPERALEAARRGLERAATEDLRVARCGWLRIRGLAYARLGSRQEADVAFAEAVALARQMPYPFREGAILLDWGRILASSGREDEGRRCLQQAGAVFEMLGAVDDHARVMKSLAALS